EDLGAFSAAQDALITLRLSGEMNHWPWTPKGREQASASVHSKWRQTSPNPSRTGVPPVLLVSTFRESRKPPDRTEKNPSPGGASPSLGRGANIGERFSFYPVLAKNNALNPLTRGRRKDETGS